MTLPVLLLLTACTGSGGGSKADPLGEVSVRLSDGVETVVIVDWELTEAADAVWVEYGPDDGYGETAPAWESDGATGRALLLGLRGDEDVHLRLVAQRGESVEHGEDRQITTGSVLSTIPAGTLESDEGEDFGDYVVTSSWSQLSGETSVVILDREGGVVWHTDPVPGTILAARPSRDGRAVVYQVTDGPFATEGAEICRAELDGESTTCVATPMGHHDFVELPDGGWGWLRAETRSWEGYELIGDALVTQDADGNVTEIWNAFDWITPSPDATWDQLETPDGVDWSHTNGLWHDEVEDAWYLTFLHLEMMHKVVDGATQWVLGGQDNQFAADGALFGPLHAPMAIDGGVMLFDNTDRGSDGSRVRSYALDEGAHTAATVLDLVHPDGSANHTLGDAVQLDGGYVLGAFGENADLVVWSPAGEVSWRMTIDGVACQVTVVDDLYTMGQ